MKIIQIPEILPVLPLAGAFVFPKMLFPLEVSGASAISLIDEAMAGDRLIGLVMLKHKAGGGRRSAPEGGFLQHRHERRDPPDGQDRRQQDPAPPPGDQPVQDP